MIKGHIYTRKKVLLQTLLLVSLHLIITSGLFAQHLNIRNFAAREGLIQSQVQTILQDNDGYLWFGTVNGVSCYDGREFKTFTVNDGLAGNYIFSGLKDSKGDLWFGHNHSLVSRYHWKEKKFTQLLLKEKNKKTNPAKITKIFMDSRKQIWFVTDNDGIYYLENDSLIHITIEQGLTSNNTTDICQIDDETYWVANWDRICIYKLTSGVTDSITAKNGLPKTTILSLLNDGTGNIWIGTGNSGVLKYNLKPQGNQKQIIKFTKEDGLPSLYVDHIYKLSDGQIWVSSFLNGVAHFVPSGKKGYFSAITTENGLPFRGVNSVFRDREGNHWFGTDGRGVAQLRDGRFDMFTIKQGLVSNSTWAVFVDSKKNKWFGTNEGITCIFNSSKKTLSFSKYKNRQLQKIINILEDTRGNIWFLSYEMGVFYIDNQRYNLHHFKLPKNFSEEYIMAIEKDIRGNIWFASLFDGLVRYNPKEKEFSAYTRKSGQIISDSLYAICRDKDRNLWIGTLNKGVMKYDGINFKKQPIPLSSVLSMAEGSENDMWFIDQKDQLFRWYNDELIEYGATRGLKGHSLYSVIADSKSVWVGTSVGVARLIYGDSMFKFFGYKEGFPITETNEGAAYKDAEGRLWFGTLEGAVRYHPELEELNSVAPKTSIHNVQLFSKNINFVEKTEFASGENYLTFNFIGISLTVPERVKYRYRLLGLDEKWSEETRIPTVTYSNLSPGVYNFQVIACNNDGVWNKVPAEYKFKISHPFWMTWWFEFLTAMLLFLIVYLIIRIRTNRIEKDKLRLGRKVEERTLELRQEKERLEATLGALKESESRFKVYTDISTAAIYIHQNDRFKYVNHATELISGYTKEELYKMNIWDLVHPDYVKLVKERFLARLSGGDVPGRYEFKLVVKDRAELWVDFSGRLILYKGQPALLATILDITERKKAEENLRTEKERLDVTLRSINEGVITTDIDGRIVLTNDMANSVLEYESGALLGKYIGDAFLLSNEKNPEKTDNPIELVIDSDGHLRPEGSAILTSKENSKTIIEYSCSALKDNKEKLTGVVFIFRDITEKRQLEEEVIKSQKLESVGVLAGGIAHDFNNILTAIIGNLSLAKLDLNPDAKIYKRIENAEKASARAQELTQQLLTFSKGGAPIKQETSVKSLLDDSVAFILSGSNVGYTLEMDEKLPLVNIDAGQISQVIQNLVINADQAMPEGGNIQIRVQTRFGQDIKNLNLKEKKYIQIDVVDEGVGIPEEYIYKIFDPFFSTKKSGSGLGLATCYSIIKKHEGEITVQSRVGEGTVFSIYLPALEKEGIPENNGMESNTIEKGSGRILIMDDESYILETASDMLNYLGFDVAVSENGEEAVNEYTQAMRENKPFDVVIMDLTIPGGMGGEKAVKKLLEIDADVKAVVASGYSNDPVMSNYREYGFSGCLKKPFRLEDIGEVIKSFGLMD